MTTPSDVLRSMFDYHFWATETLIDHLGRLPADLLDGWARSGQALPGGLGTSPAAGSPDGGSGTSDPAELRAAMSGTVVKWLVEPGAEVAAGDPVVVLEAMKMETSVPAHRGGVVSGVAAGAGDVVTSGSVLALIS